MAHHSDIDELADRLGNNMNVSPSANVRARLPQFVRKRVDNRGPPTLNPSAGHFVVFGAWRNGYYADQRGAAAAIDGIDSAFFETFEDKLSALSAASAAAKTGELELGYDHDPDQSALNNADSHSDSVPTTPLRTRAPSALPRSYSQPSAPPSHASNYEDSPPRSPRSPHSSISPSYGYGAYTHSQSSPSVPRDHPVPVASASAPIFSPNSVPSPTPTGPSSSASLNMITVMGAAGVFVTYPAPYEAPLPTVPRKIRVSKKNKNFCYAVWVGRRPGIYYTWPETYAQIEGIPSGAQQGYPSQAEALARYHLEGRLGNVRVASGLP